MAVQLTTLIDTYSDLTGVVPIFRATHRAHRFCIPRTNLVTYLRDSDMGRFHDHHYPI